MRRYYELVLSERQLAFLLVALAAVVLAAFGFGVAVGVLEPKQQSVSLKINEVSSERLEDGENNQREASLPELPTPTALALSLKSEMLPEPSPVSPAETQPAEVKRSTPEGTPSPTAKALPLTSVKPSSLSPTPQRVRVWVQVATLSRKQHADGVRLRVIALGFRPNQVRVVPGGEGKYRVRVGPFPDKESGNRVSQRLRASGFSEAFVVTP